MDRAKVHFELFVRPHRRAPWALALATEDRRAAFEAADELRAGNQSAAVRLNKETCDPTSGHFRPLVLLEHVPGPQIGRPKRVAGMRPASPAPACARVDDLHADAARETIGRVLAGWLQRNRVTPFELLHRADLAERLEACSAELSAALYNAALSEAAARGGALEPIRRRLDTLARQAIERVTGDDPDMGFRLGVAVATRLGASDGSAEKIEALLDLIEAAPETGRPATVALRVLQQPLIDLIRADGGFGEVAGPGLAAGDQLLILIQIASAPAIAALACGTDAPGGAVPRPSGLAARLAMGLHARTAFAPCRRAIARLVMEVLAAEARLWPDDPAREVDGLRALSALLQVAGKLVDQDEVAAALARRWRRMGGRAFVDARLSQCRGAVEEVEVMLDLAEAAVGRGAVEAIGRRLLALLWEGGFEQEIRFNPDPVRVNLRRLASIAARLRDGPLGCELRAQSGARVRRLAGAIKADAAALDG